MYTNEYVVGYIAVIIIVALLFNLVRQVPIVPSRSGTFSYTRTCIDWGLEMEGEGTSFVRLGKTYKQLCTGPCHALCIQGQTMFKILINKKTEWAPAFIRSLRQSEEEGDKLLADRIIKAAHDSARQQDRHS